MRRYLLCPMTEGRGLGPVSQLLAVAEELAVRGHECLFVANAEHTRLLEALGFPCLVAPVPDHSYPLVDDFRLGDAARAMGVTDPAYFAKALAVERDAVDLFRPHALLAAVKLTTAVTARSKGVPLVSIAASTDSPGFTSPLYHDRPTEPLSVGLRDVLSLNGFDSVVDLAELSYEMSDHRVAPFSREFDPFLPTERLSYVGPLLSRGFDLYCSVASVRPRRGDLIIVYVNRGSQPVEHYLDLIETAAQDLPSYHFVVVERDGYGERRPPDNMSVLASAPILRMLHRAALFVSGGGYNSIMAAMLTGTPVVGLPGRCAERDFNLRRVVELGAGVLVPGYPADATDAVGAMHRVLGDPAFRDRADLVGDQLRRLPGPPAVVDILGSP